MHIKHLLHGDIAAFRQLLDVFADVFEMKDFSPPDDAYLKRLLAREEFIVLVANEIDTVIGGLTAYMLPSYYGRSSELYLYDLAVRTAFQRRGVGRKLLESLTAYCREHGVREFFVQADAPDEQALNFYSALGGIPEKVVHFTYPIK